MEHFGHFQPGADLEEDLQLACCDCRLLSPPVRTAYTLIGARFRWRLHRVIQANGDLALEWRCPGCWTRFRKHAQPRRPSG
jgi:hypothetical protein